MRQAVDRERWPTPWGAFLACEAEFERLGVPRALLIDRKGQVNLVHTCETRRTNPAPSSNR